MSWLSRLFSGATTPTAVTSPPPSVDSPAERRKYILSGTVPCATFTSDYDSYPVAVTTDSDQYDALVAAWVADRPERCQIVYLRPDPRDHIGVLVQRSPATTIGCLSPIDASLYRGLIEAIADLGLACTAGAKTDGGTGARQRLRLALSLDSPEQIAADFAIPPERIARQRPSDDAAQPPQSREATTPSESILSLRSDHPRFVGVVGESHYQATLKRMVARAPSAWVTIEGEPENPYDKNAVRIANEAGETIGYLARGRYTRLKKIARVAPVACSAELRGGTSDKPSIGIVIDPGDSFADNPDRDDDDAG